MKLGCLEIWLKVSNISSLVCPRAGTTVGLGVVGVESCGSGFASTGPSLGEAFTGVPTCGELMPLRLVLNALVGSGGARRSMVNAKKSSCCSLR